MKASYGSLKARRMSPVLAIAQNSTETILLGLAPKEPIRLNESSYQKELKVKTNMTLETYCLFRIGAPKNPIHNS